MTTPTARARGQGFGFYSTASARAPLTDLRAPARHPLSAIPPAGMNAITIISPSAHTNVEPNAFASGVAITVCARAGRSCSAASPPEPELEARALAIGRLLVTAEARITDRIAAPTDAPDCRMMFIAVLVRAMAEGGTGLHGGGHRRHHRQAHAEPRDEADAAQEPMDRRVRSDEGKRGHAR